MVKNKKSVATPQAIYRRMRNEWHIQSNLAKTRKMPLQELGVTPMDVNWLLNKVEWEYHFQIEEGNISSQATLEEFIQLILQASKNQVA